MTIEELLKQQSILQADASQILEILSLEVLFKDFGTLVIGGSYVTGLMTWPDIDVAILQEDKPKRSQMHEIVRLLFKNDIITGVNVMDNTSLLNPHHPNGIYCGIKCYFNDKKWKIDLWFVKDGTPVGLEDVKMIKKELNEEKKITILRIKYAIFDNPKYKKSIFSTDIYEAVIHQGVTNLDEFKDFLAKSNRQL